VSDIELVLDPGRDADAARFFHAGASLLALLDALADTAYATWVIDDLRVGSAISGIAAAQERDAGLRAIGSAALGLARARDGASLPSDWTPDAVAQAKDLARQVNGHGHLRHEGNVIFLDRELGQSLEERTPWTREFYGSIRGELTGFNVTRRRRASLRPQDGGRVVHISFPDALTEQMRAGLMQFVEVEGLVRQDGDGRNYSIRAEKIEVHSEPEATWADLRGLVPEITEGLSVSDYLRAVRGED